MEGAGSFLDIESFTCNHNLNVQRKLLDLRIHSTAIEYGALRIASTRTWHFSVYRISYLWFTGGFILTRLKLLERKRQNLGRVGSR